MSKKKKSGDNFGLKSTKKSGDDFGFKTTKKSGDDVGFRKSNQNLQELIKELPAPLPNIDLPKIDD
ncbi:hypothetical protein [Rivularia sp. UHCC 0363]|uniref:hypothetical protein n=1 Tax=Rivularia sp. UHCC 0363 TaxID=3110244 RepID=UPI002B1F582C|nr:hypothetical protein [Rivularia sp. UHCC 0363]MEA5596005.1 hypothetical protein [Rivularia sp. UHCC 0363]